MRHIGNPSRSVQSSQHGTGVQPPTKRETELLQQVADLRSRISTAHAALSGLYALSTEWVTMGKGLTAWGQPGTAEAYQTCAQALSGQLDKLAQVLGSQEVPSGTQVSK